jgi:hypothetical protein
MKFSHISLIAVMLVVIAVAFAGCAGTSPATPATQGTPATSSPTGSSSPGSSGSSSAATVSGADLFGGLSYNWVEYKMSTGSGNEAMTIYYKYNRQTGKCTMRFEGAGATQVQGMPSEMDCSGTGSQTSQGDPNKVSSDTQISCSPLEETVVVPAGTFSATKCTMTTQGNTATTWIARGKFMVKMESSSSQGSMNMVLNSYG